MKDENGGKLGIGTLSPLISILTLFCLIQYRGEISILDLIIEYVGLPIYSANGIYYTVFYALIPMIISFHIGIKYPTNFEAMFGKKVAGWFMIISSIYGVNVII